MLVAAARAPGGGECDGLWGQGPGPLRARRGKRPWQDCGALRLQGRRGPGPGPVRAAGRRPDRGARPLPERVVEGG